MNPPTQCFSPNPLVSIVVPAFNHESYVKTCLDSVFNQSYREIELLIINDGSSDKTHQEIQNWIDNCPPRFIRFQYINRENFGLTKTLNQGLEWSQGKYFSSIASDDILAEDKIKLLVSELEKKGTSFSAAFGNAKFIDDLGQDFSMKIEDIHGSIVGKTTLFLEYYTHERKFDFRDPEYFGTYPSLLAGNYLPAMSNLLRTSCIREVGGWTSGNTVEDWELWLKLSKTTRFCYVDEIVAFYRWHESNASKVKRERILRDSIKLLEKERDFAVSNAYQEYFYPVFFYNIKLLKEVDFKEFQKKLLSLLMDFRFIRFAFKKILRRGNA